MAKESNQAEDLSEGHTPNGDLSDPHAHPIDGGHIGLSTNFGIAHGGVMAGMHEGSNPTDEK